MNRVPNRRPATRPPSRSRRRVTVPKKSPRTTIPIVDEIWWQLHGTRRVWGGALRGQTTTDYFLLTCPCGALLARGIGVRLVGSSDHLDERLRSEHRDNGEPRRELPTEILVFEIDCPWCGLLDHIKFEIDQRGTLTNEVRMHQTATRAVNSDDPREGHLER